MKKWITSMAVIFVFIGLALSCSDDDDFWSAMIPETNDEPTSA